MHTFKHASVHTHTLIKFIFNSHKDTPTEPSGATGSSDGAAAQAHLQNLSAPPKAEPKMLSVQMLSGFQKTSAGATPLPTSLKGINACQFFQQQMDHGNTTVASGLSRGLEEAKPLMQWFVSMATLQEKNILMPLKAVVSVGSVALISNQDRSARDAMRKFISQRLDVLVRARLIQCFFDACLPCPPGLLTWCGGGKSGNSTDDLLTATAPGTYERYLKCMGVTAIVPVQDSLIEWRKQHELLTFHPEQVLQLPDVLYKVNPSWCITACTKKKQLKLEGFSVLDEWSDTTRVRPWSNGWKAVKDTEWLQEYYKKKKKSMGSGEGAAAPS